MSNNATTSKWDTLNWSIIESRTWRIQKRIYQAALTNNKTKVRFLQLKLVNSLDAKLQAVRLVTSLNKGKKTPGVDKKLYVTPNEKWQLSNSLNLDGKAAPIRQVLIPSKPGKTTTRPLGIPILKDRAKQALAKMALEPEWEAKFEPNSYGFRPGRGCHDAIERIFMSLNNPRKREKNHKYILDADLKGCFNNISHEHILDHINNSPKKIKDQVKAWLRAGAVEGFTEAQNYYLIPETEIGTPQGGIISPLLCNIALHGLETHLKDWILKRPHKGIAKRDQLNSLTIVRYADDFVVIHKDKMVILEAKQEIISWLEKTSKIQLNEEKTKIRYSPEGFNFLGFTIIHVTKNFKTKTRITASKESINNMTKKVKTIANEMKSAGAYEFIKRIRPITLGWANYFCVGEWKETASKVNHKIFTQTLRPWVFRKKAKNKGRQWIKAKYFPNNQTWKFQGKEYQDNWVLYGKTKIKDKEVEIFLPHIQWVPSKKHVKIQEHRSPYDGDNYYWGIRSEKYGSLNTSERKLLRTQKGKCTICKTAFKIGDQHEVDHIIPKSQNGQDTYRNLQLVHKTCHQRKSSKENTARTVS